MLLTAEAERLWAVPCFGPVAAALIKLASRGRLAMRDMSASDHFLFIVIVKCRSRMLWSVGHP